MSQFWILALTVALLHCLTAQTRYINASDTLSKILYGEIATDIGELQKVGCNETDSSFYTNSGSGECTIKALNCSILELETVKNECLKENPENTERIDGIIERIEDMLKLKDIKLQANPINCFCGQEHVQKPYNDFLDNILKLLQMLNSSSPNKA